MPDQIPDDTPGAGPSADIGVDSTPEAAEKARVEQAEDEARAADAMPQAKVHRGWSFSLIWVVPVVAALVAGWLGFRSIASQGPSIKITFETADGLEAGRTPIRHKNVLLGTVKSIEPTDDLKRVVVTADMTEKASKYLTENTRFWVVRPRLSAAGISGLNTIVSGAYVEMQPGEGKPNRDFTGLEQPPVVQPDEPGHDYNLISDRLGSVNPGSPILFLGIEVGQVLGYDLASGGDSVTLHIFVRAPFDRYVTDKTVFWNASGIGISAGAQGFALHTESLQSVLQGGIAFKATVAGGKPSPQNAVFALYKDEASTGEAAYTQHMPYLAHFDGSIRGLSVGATVEFRGTPVGRVTDVNLIFDPKTNTVSQPVLFDIEPQRFIATDLNAMPPTTSQPATIDQAKALMGEMVRHGLRAQLASGSLITGQMYVSLDYFPSSPPADVITGGAYPEIPTEAASSIAEIERSAGQFLDKLTALPLKPLVEDVRRAIQHADTLVASPDIKRSLANIERITRTADQQLAPLLSSLNQTAQSAQNTADALESALGRNGPMNQDVGNSLQELRRAAVSVRSLADYLERHPESLISGKKPVR